MSWQHSQSCWLSLAPSPVHTQPASWTEGFVTRPDAWVKEVHLHPPPHKHRRHSPKRLTVGAIERELGIETDTGTSVDEHVTHELREASCTCSGGRCPHSATNVLVVDGPGGDIDGPLTVPMLWDLSSGVSGSSEEEADMRWEDFMSVNAPLPIPIPPTPTHASVGDEPGTSGAQIGITRPGSMSSRQESMSGSVRRGRGGRQMGGRGRRAHAGRACVSCGHSHGQSSGHTLAFRAQPGS